MQARAKWFVRQLHHTHLKRKKTRDMVDRRQLGFQALHNYGDDDDEKATYACIT